jgi:2-(3-amino-3-carboxypropyl)histidine synthase
VDGIVDTVFAREASLVALQLPEGLKRQALDLATRIEKATGVTVIVSADPCFGACDLLDDQLGPLGVDLVVHIGHTPLGDTLPGLPTVFVEAPSRLDVGPAVEAAVPLLPPEGRIGLLTTTQHRHVLSDAMSVLEEAGFRTLVGEGGRRLAFPGQVLGCDLSAGRAIADKVDAFLLVGGGSFHAVGVALASQRMVVVADVEMGQARRIDDERDRILRRRSAAIGRAKDARSFGILVEGRPGQQRWALARSLREMLLEHRLRPLLLHLRGISPDRLVSIGLDAYVSTACPRIAVDDQSAYPMPVLTPQEVRILLGLESWGSYRLDEIG